MSDTVTNIHVSLQQYRANTVGLLTLKQTSNLLSIQTLTSLNKLNKLKRKYHQKVLRVILMFLQKL